MKRSIIIIGSGNLAESLAAAIASSPELELRQIWARNPQRGQLLADRTNSTTTHRKEELAKADIYLLAVSDRAVGELSESLPIPPESIVAHTAGSVPMEALAKYPNRGIFYPFQGFSAGRIVSFEAIPLFIEGANPRVVEVLKEVASTLSRQVYEADSERRRRIHLAGVLANNFVNALYQAAAEVLEKADLPFEVLKPLIVETALKAIEAQQPCDVQTGPAKRGDVATQQGHLHLLEGEERLQQIYQLLSEQIWETSKKI